MSRSTSAPIVGLAGALALCAGLAGCSQTGGMGRPFERGANQPRQQQDPNHPTQTIDPRDASGTPAPSRTLPIPGTAPNPIGVAPPGALPDPYANPPR